MVLRRGGCAPNSSPSLWAQLPDCSFGDLQTPGNSQQYAACSDRSREASTEAKGYDEDFDPFDVGAPWTQLQQLPTQVQRKIWLGAFNDDPDAASVETSGVKEHREEEPVRTSNSLNKRSRSIAKDSNIGSQSSNSRQYPRSGDWASDQLSEANRESLSCIETSNAEATRGQAASNSSRAHHAQRDGEQVPEASGSSTSSFCSVRQGLCEAPNEGVGLAPLLPQLSPAKRAGYWAQLLDDASSLVDLSTLGDKSAYGFPEKRCKTPNDDPRIPFLRRSVADSALRAHTDSRLLPNHFTPSMAEESAATQASSAGCDRTVRLASPDNHYESPLLQRLQRLQESVEGPIAMTTERHICTRTTTTTRASLSTGPAGRHQLSRDSICDEHRRSVPISKGRGNSLAFAPRSRNAVGMGLAKKTWATTWRADGARVVKGRVVFNKASNQTKVGAKDCSSDLKALLGGKPSTRSRARGHRRDNVG